MEVPYYNLTLLPAMYFNILVNDIRVTNRTKLRIPFTNHF